MTSPGNIDVPGLLTRLGIKYQAKGRDWWAPCPAHAETEASWHMDATGTHNCFGCGFSGSPGELVAFVRKCGIKDALDWMKSSTKAHQPVVEMVVRTRRSMSRKFVMPDYITGPSEQWVTSARKYITKRNVTNAQIAKWRIGYSIAGRLFGRIVFPIFSSAGDALGYHGRTFGSDDKRYLYPDRDECADRGAVFGQQYWTFDGELTLTEGAFDALACERAGAANIGAIGGSEPTSQQVLRLSRWDRILVVSDGDKAGDKLFDMIHARLFGQTEVRRAVLPRGTDACDVEDSLGIESLRRMLV